jgi:AraC family transcriptional regulator of arabinose operon
MSDKNKKKSGINHELALEGNVIEAKYFFFDTLPRTKVELAIIFGGREICAPDFEIKRRSYPYYVLEVPVRGRCILKVGSKKYELEKGKLGGFMPGIAHHYKCDPANPMEHIWVAFTGTQSEKLFDISGLNTKGALNISKQGEILHLAEMILKTGLEKTKFAQQLCCSYLRALFFEQSARLPAGKKFDMISMGTYQKCRKYIDEHFSQNLYPSKVARACNIDVRYMARLFKRFGETTPNEYIMRLKLNRASSLLLTSNLTVSEVANTVGFDDPYHFSRNFKKFHGLSPRNYKSSHI